MKRLIAVTVVTVMVFNCMAQEQSGQPKGRILRDAAEVPRSDIAKQDPIQRISTALRESIPPVPIHEWIFNGGPVRLLEVWAISKDGKRGTDPVVLEYEGSGLVIGSDLSAYPVATGDVVLPGEIILGCVILNSGDTAVQLRFDSGRVITLASGKRFYIGTKERVLRYPDGRPEDKALYLGPVSHCFVCECSCDGGGASSNISFEADEDTKCGGHNGITCYFDLNGSQVSGTTSGCSKALVECKDSN